MMNQISQKFLLICSFAMLAGSCQFNQLGQQKNQRLDRFLKVENLGKSCPEEFTITRVNPDPNNFDYNNVLAENRSCLIYLFFQYNAEKEKYFVNKITLVATDREYLLSEKALEVDLEEIGIGSRLSFEAMVEEKKVSFRLYMQGRSTKQPFTTARSRS